MRRTPVTGERSDADRARLERARVGVALAIAAPFPALQGSQLLVRQLALGLATRGYRVHLITYGEGAGGSDLEVPVHRIPRLPGCHVHSSGPHPARVVLDALFTLRLAAVVRREHLDLIHAHNYEATMAALLVGKLGRRPVVYHGHSAMGEELPTYFRRPWARKLARRVGRMLDSQVPRRADYCIAVSAELVTMLRRAGVGPQEVECIVPGAVPDEVEVGEAARARVRHRLGDRDLLLYAGNLDGYQNLGLLLRSFAAAVREAPAARLVVVTHGDPRPLRRRVEAMGLGERVMIVATASFSEVRGLLAAADIAVCPRTEPSGFPMKLLNYMAAGKAIVACEGSAKSLVDGYNALVVADDDQEAFTRALLRLLRDPEKRARLGQAARATLVSAHGWEAVLDRVEAIYQKLLAREDSGEAAVRRVAAVACSD